MKRNPFHPQEMISEAHRGAAKNFISLGYLHFVFLAITLFSAITVKAASIRKVTGSTMDSAELSATNLNFQNINNEQMNTVHKTSTETIHGQKTFTDLIAFSTFTATSATITTLTATTGTIANIVSSSIGTNQIAYNNGTKLVGSSALTTDGATLTVTSITLNGLLYAGNPVGTVVMYVSSSTTPSGWLYCDGSSKSTSTYNRLFATIGYTFGGSGANFTLPDFQGVFPKGQGTTARAAGKDSSGNFYSGTNGTYSTDKMQGHFHQIPTTASALGSALAADRGSALGTPDLSSAGPITDGTNGTPRTGHTTEPQSLGINFIIYAGI